MRRCDFNPAGAAQCALDAGHPGAHLPYRIESAGCDEDYRRPDPERSRLLEALRMAEIALDAFHDLDPHHAVVPGRFFHDCAGGCGKCDAAEAALAAIERAKR